MDRKDTVTPFDPAFRRSTECQISVTAVEAAEERAKVRRTDNQSHSGRLNSHLLKQSRDQDKLQIVWCGKTYDPIVGQRIETPRTPHGTFNRA